jgi:predicted DNA-binding transcriptional regulator YafY
MIPNILKLLVTAVKEKRCVAIRYHDQRDIRVIEPHAVYTGEHGEIMVDAFQVRGYSAAGRPPPFWRPFRLKKIASASLMNESFIIRSTEGFSANRPRYQKGLVAIVAGAGPGNREARAVATLASPSQMAYPPQAVGADIGPQLPHGYARR